VFRAGENKNLALQWGRSFEAAETKTGRKSAPETGKSFNGAAALRLRKLNELLQAQYTALSFNGAAALRLRKLANELRSMRPAGL